MTRPTSVSLAAQHRAGYALLRPHIVWGGEVTRARKMHATFLRALCAAKENIYRYKFTRCVTMLKINVAYNSLLPILNFELFSYAIREM